MAATRGLAPRDTGSGAAIPGGNIPKHPHIELHGWDARTQCWTEPHELAYRLRESRHILDHLRQLPGSWYGHLKAELPGQLSLSFCASVYDLGDAALGVLDLAGTEGGPLEFVLVVPPQRRARLRPEFAFEFVSFLRFLQGPHAAHCELALHDHIEHTCAQAAPETTLVFSVETGQSDRELHALVGQQAERLAMAMVAWMYEKDGASQATH
jgi:hypothetical protein